MRDCEKATLALPPHPNPLPRNKSIWSGAPLAGERGLDSAVCESRFQLLDQDLNFGQVVLRVPFEDHSWAFQVDLAAR